MGFGKTDALRHFVRKLHRPAGSSYPPDSVFRVKEGMTKHEGVKSIELVVKQLRQWALSCNDMRILAAVPEYDIKSRAWWRFDEELSKLLRGEMKAAYEMRRGFRRVQEGSGGFRQASDKAVAGLLRSVAPTTKTAPGAQLGSPGIAASPSDLDDASILANAKAFLASQSPAERDAPSPLSSAHGSSLALSTVGGNKREGDSDAADENEECYQQARRTFGSSPSHGPPPAHMPPPPVKGEGEDPSQPLLIIDDAFPLRGAPDEARLDERLARFPAFPGLCAQSQVEFELPSDDGDEGVCSDDVEKAGGDAEEMEFEEEMEVEEEVGQGGGLVPYGVRRDRLAFARWSHMHWG
jgi:hypothetical protein